MRLVHFTDIVAAVGDMCLEAAFDLPDDVFRALKRSLTKEKSPLGQSLLKSVLENAAIAKKDRVPLCQDTGFAVFFVEIGSTVVVEGGVLTDAINEGVRRGYGDGFLRASIVDDPLFQRKNTRDNTPCVIHVKPVAGDKLSIMLAPKGGGCENMSALTMLKPSEGSRGVIDFVVRTVVKAGPNPCPPTIVGVGIGGTADMAAILAKKALLRPVRDPHPDPEYAKLENAILDAINDSGIGSQGLGGTVTALAVHIETFPCHIASLPVAVNLNCHAARHAGRVL